MKSISSALVITTYNWPQALELILKSVVLQLHLPTMIVIADDGSLYETKVLIDKYREKISIPILHIWQEDKGFRKSKILNKAIAQAQVDYIIQVDGDCILHPHFIEDHLANIKDNCYLYGTRVNIKEQFVSNIFQFKIIKFSCFSNKIKNKTRSIRCNILSQLNKVKLGYSDKFRGCNVSFWKKDFININGYNEDFEGWGREDSDLVIRMSNNGVLSKRLKFCAIVFHIFHPLKTRDNFERNDAIQNQTILNKTTFIDKGVNQYI
jgi:glycosyltransferase involved in cell wall biosynthesis